MEDSGRIGLSNGQYKRVLLGRDFFNITVSMQNDIETLTVVYQTFLENESFNWLKCCILFWNDFFF